ncbi:MAG: OmpA family protein [Myxococcota bacterium]
MLSLRLPLLFALSTPAFAQDYDGGLDAHGFVLAAQDGDVRDVYTLQRPGEMQGGNWFASGLLEYASRPLVLVDETGADVQRDAALDNLLGLNLSAGVSPHERVRLSAGLPLFFTSSSFGDSQGAGLGDLRLDAMVMAVIPEDDEGFGLGVVPWIDIPVGSTSQFLGRSKVAGGGAVAASYGFERATLMANLGLQFDPTVDGLENLTGSDLLVAGIGGNYLLTEESSLGLEVKLASPFSANDKRGTGSPSEAILGYRQRLDSGAFFSGGLAAPLSRGVGAAAFRVFIGGGFGKMGPGAPKDTDLDGITDDVDACINEPETVNDYLDTDGCPDGLSNLIVEVQYNGAPVEGADLVVSGGEGEPKASKTGPTPWAGPVIPGSAWEMTATKGECLKGTTKAMVGEGETLATVAMELVPSSTLNVIVKDSSGKPVPTAQMTWESSAPECLDSSPPPFGANGQAQAKVGPGTHTLYIGAPGYRIVEESVDIKSGDDRTVEVVLAPTKLKMEGNKIVILEKVEFETAKATIRPVSYELLNEVADIIMRNPKAGRVEVQGHTDSRGSDSYNLDLSQRRAESVRNYLSKRGVDRARLIAAGFGETRPIESNATSAGRTKNRRVEFLLIDQKSQSITEPAE